MNYFCKFVGDDASLVEPVEIEVGYGEPGRFVFFGNRECRAGDFVLATCAGGQPARKGRLTTAQVTDELYNFATTQFTSQLLREGFGLFGTGGNGFPGHVGTHTTYMLPRERLRRQ